MTIMPGAREEEARLEWHAGWAKMFFLFPTERKMQTIWLYFVCVCGIQYDNMIWLYYVYMYIYRYRYVHSGVDSEDGNVQESSQKKYGTLMDTYNMYGTCFFTSIFLSTSGCGSKPRYPGYPGHWNFWLIGWMWRCPPNMDNLTGWKAHPRKWD